MKKFLFLALITLGFASCSKDELSDVNNSHSGEVETSYISINLTAADNTTRANDGTYQEGLDAERAVKCAYFFFFDAEGNAFPVTATAGNPATGDEGEINWISASLNTTDDDMPNVSDIKNAVLILSTYEGTYPSQVVAVLNWVPNPDITYSLADLQAATTIEGVENSLVMSNAVYSDGTKAVIGTPLTASDIYKDETNALANPITIHVERTAAKVTVTANGVDDSRFKITKTVSIGGSEVDVYVQVTGWALHNDFAQSYLLKQINPSWEDDVLGFTWNDSPYYRCYWANSIPFDDIGENEFPITLPYALGNVSNVNSGTYADNTYTYVGENTNYVNGNTDKCTKVILKGKLQQKIGDTYEDLPLARWYTTYYTGVNDLLTAVANTIRWQYYWYDSVNTKYVSIAPSDITVEKDGGKVKFVLSVTGESRNWFVKNGGGYTSKGKDDMNASLATLQEAIYYENGETLYSVDIAHLGNGTTDDHKLGDYGIVRNHIYNVVIKSFGGFGSPVYVPISNIVYPEGPADTGEYVSAEVRVLSWRLVSHEVEVQP